LPRGGGGTDDEHDDDSGDDGLAEQPVALDFIALTLVLGFTVRVRRGDGDAVAVARPVLRRHAITAQRIAGN